MKIKKLVLYTAALEPQMEFYGEVLGFPVSYREPGSFTLQAGDTELAFIASSISPYYHFAFLIPDNKLYEAIAFLEEKGIDLLPYKNAKIIEFQSGRAIYFYDPAGNIAEFIIRPSLDIQSNTPFSIEQVQRVNEIGLPVSTPIRMAHHLMDQYGIIPLAPDSFTPHFCWVGDHEGVIIVVGEGRHWLPTDKPGIVNDFELHYEERGKDYKLKFENNKISTV